ncbi:MAG: type VI secretion protein IcmF/TssM N-terminal domain-containing protein [Pseudomonadota bacterium]
MKLILAAAVLIFLICSGIVAYYLWRNKKRLKAEAAAEDRETQRSVDAETPQPSQAKQLEAKWKAGLQILADSQLRQQGDPLYVLPWYVLLGRTGSGKSSAVRNSRVHMPFTELPPWSEIGATANLDWWFLDPVVILDLAGRYASGADSPENRQEWQRFVQLLCATRKNEPLNGVIVCLPLEDLKTRGVEDLKEDAKKIRRRLDVLMDASGMEFPVYLMVSKCDLAEGFVEFFRNVPEKGREQTLGALNRPRGRETPPRRYFEENFEELVERLRRLRLSILSDLVDGPEVDKVFLLPEGLTRLKEPLGVFIETLFAETQYETTPFFRGFFLASAKQEGEPFAGFPSMFSMENETSPQVPDAQSYFLADFFGKTTARDRVLGGFSAKTRDWRKRAVAAALLAWSALWLIAGIQLTVSFGLNWKIINQAAPRLDVMAARGGPLESALAWFEGKNRAALQIYRDNRDSALPRLGLEHSFAAEKKVRQGYVDEFRAKLLAPLDEALARKVKELNAGPPAPPEPPRVAPTPAAAGLADFRGKQDSSGEAAPEPSPIEPAPAAAPSNEPPSGPEQTAAAVQFILDRSALLKYAQEHPAEVDLAGLAAQPDYGFWLACALPEKTPDQVNNLRDEYLGYLRWQDDPAAIREEIDLLNALLREVLRRDGQGFNWLIGWAAGRVDEFHPLTYKTFWENDLTGLPGGETEVARPFTLKAWETGIKPMLDRLSAAASDQEDVQALISGFKTSYWEKYQDNWEYFLKNFAVGLDLWTLTANRVEAAPRVLGDKSPFLKVLETAGSELRPLAENAPQPTRPWVRLILNYDKWRKPEFQEVFLAWIKKEKEAGQTPGFFQQAVGQAKELAQSALGKDFEASEDELEAIGLWVDFEDNIRQVPLILTDAEKCYGAAKAAFTEGRATSASVHPILKAQWDLNRLREISGRGRVEEQPFWGLFDQLLGFGWRTELEVAGEHLQKQWENDVLSEVTDLEGWSKMETLLYGEKSKVWEFVDGPAGPFLEKKKDGGYAPRVLLDQGLPFSDDFLKMLAGARKGRQQLSTGEGALNVRLEARPTDVNQKALTGIERTTVKLLCGAEVQVMEHFNFPVSKVFTWTPDKCRDLVIEFEGGRASAQKEYTGYLAFPQFLADIAEGQKTYSIKELKTVSGDLQARGVKTITAKFRAQGNKPVLKFLENTPGDIPDNIIRAAE